MVTNSYLASRESGLWFSAQGGEHFLVEDGWGPCVDDV
jgi:hypothetical protein